MVRCPVSSAHVLVEVAADLHQCPECGAGPTEYWSVGFLEVDGLAVGGLCATWRPDLQCYTLAHVSWTVDKAGHRRAMTMHVVPIGYASTATELAETPLPARGEGELLRLREGMFSSALGEKIVQTGGRTGRSGAGPSPAGSSADSPRRRRRSVS